MSILELKTAWFGDWRIIGRLVLLYLAMLVFWLPLAMVAGLLPETAWHGWAVMLSIFNTLVIVPIGTYYGAKWCKEFKDETG